MGTRTYAMGMAQQSGNYILQLTLHLPKNNITHIHAAVMLTLRVLCGEVGRKPAKAAHAQTSIKIASTKDVTDRDNSGRTRAADKWS